MSIKNIITAIFILFFSISWGQNYLNRDWKYYLKKGDKQFKGEMYDYALESYEKVLDRNDKAYQAANMLAKISLMKNKKEQALKWYLKSLKIKKSQPDIHYKTGFIYDFFADYDKAYYHFSESIGIKTDHIKSNMALVRFYYKRKKYTKARYHYQISYKAGIKIVQNQLLAAQRFESINYKKSIEEYKMIIEKAPATLQAHSNLFNLYRQKGMYKKAATVMEHLKFLKPDHEKAYIFLGHLYFNTILPGNTRSFYLNQAIKNLNYAHKLNPENTETLFTLARVYVYMGKPLLAKKTMIKAEKIENKKNP